MKKGVNGIRNAKGICFTAVFLTLLLFSPTQAGATTAQEYIDQGKAQLFQQTVDGTLAAYQTFSAANTQYGARCDTPSPLYPTLGNCSISQAEEKARIHGYLALTRLLDLMFRDDGGDVDTLTELLAQYSITRTGNDLDDIDFDVPLNNNDDIILPESAPSGEAIRSFIAGPLLDALNASIQNMDEVLYYCGIADQFGLDTSEIITAEEIDPDADPSDPDIEIDEGDYYLFRAGLKTMKAFVLIITAYDLNVDIREIVALGNLDAFNVKNFLERYEDLLKLLPTTASPSGDGAQQLADAKTALLAAIDDYLTASDKIRNDAGTQAGAEELIEIEPYELLEEAFFQEALIELRDSLQNNGPATLVTDREATWELTNQDEQMVEMQLLYEGCGYYSSTNYDDCGQFLTCGGEVDCTTIEGNTIKFEVYFAGGGPHEFAGTWELTNQEGYAVNMDLNPDGTGGYYCTNCQDCSEFIICGGEVDSTTIEDNPIGGYTITVEVSFASDGPHGGHATLTGTLDEDTNQITGGNYDGEFDTFGPFTPGTFTGERTSTQSNGACTGCAQLTGTFIADPDGHPMTITAGTYTGEFYSGDPFNEGNFTGTRTDLDEDTFKINLNPFFGDDTGPYNLRDMLPQLNDCDEPVYGTVGAGLDPYTPDATLGGILPDFTQEDWDLDDMPSGIIEIADGAGISITDTTVADWNGITPVFTDQTGDGDPDHLGSDLKDLYLAKDDQFLYVRMTLADGPPNINSIADPWQAMTYFVQFRKNAGQHRAARYIQAFFDPGSHQWRIQVVEWDYNGNMFDHYDQLGDAQAVVSGNNYDLEWRVPLNQIGPTSGRFLTTWIHWIPGYDEPDEYNETCLRIGPLTTVTGTLTVPEHDGDGPIYVGVYRYDGSFYADPDNRLGLEIIREYTAGMTYTVTNLPVGEQVFVTAHWDADFNGLPTQGDRFCRTDHFQTEEAGNTQNLVVDDEAYVVDVMYMRHSSGYQLELMAEGDMASITVVTVDGPAGSNITSFSLPNSEPDEYWGVYPGESNYIDSLDNVTGIYTFTFAGIGTDPVEFDFQPGTPMALPTGVNVADNTVSWNTVTGAVQYYVNIFDSTAARIYEGEDNTVTSGPVNISSQLAGHPYGDYNIQVVAVDPNGNEAYSDLVPFTGGSGPMWSEVSSGTSGTLNGVWGTSACNVFAVGGGIPLGNQILHYDGTTWSEQFRSGSTNNLAEVWGSSATDVFAVGYNGTILHYDGTTWSEMASGTTTYLQGVWGSSATDVFAVGGQWGSNGIILHYDGGVWADLGSVTSYQLNGVWGSSASDVFVVGYNGTILHYNGNTWSIINSGTSAEINGIWGSSATDVFAVGGIGNDSGTILHYDGSKWTEMIGGTPSSLLGVWGSSSTDVFAVGRHGTILHYDGDSWSDMPSGTSNYLSQVWGSSRNDVFAVGEAGTILHYGAGVRPGDVNGDGRIDLADAILALQVLAGLNPDGIHLSADVDGDGKIGLAEAIYILQDVAGLR